MNKFKQLGLIEPILKAIEEEKFEEPTEIQTKAIPAVVKGRDIIAGSATGSGKTLAFGAGIIQNSQEGKGIQSLVLTPTRELAEQINKSLKTFSKYKKLKITKVYGGVPIDRQIKQLRNADVVVGTPGRILDHLQRRTIDLSHINILVLDEADRMLDMGFIDDVEKIIRNCPKKRQTLLFSATISGLIEHLIKKHLHEPIKISATPMVDPKKLRQIYYDVPDQLKFSLLVHLLKKERSDLVMVFCNTKRNTDFIEQNLKLNGIDALALHGGLTQAKRHKTLEKFHSQNTHVLVCTDVAARGLDIKGISHVYNYDTPNDSKDYIHRIGRTARAGNAGIVINILGSRDHNNFGRVLKEHNINIPKEKTPYIERAKIQKRTVSREPRGKFRRQPQKRRYPRRR
ncbi:DEAD/DEAH box helicase [archaeon]|nr:DEAD/DEAH box helicase [archaeon]